ncbi:MAG TPA: DoxX family protein [Gemmatimonadales bacterium]|nr:DoxX family protein [Gemmatimonadales bacterium]
MPTTSKGANIALWITQGLLAAIFLYAGGFKLAMPMAALAKASPLPALFLKFVSVCEITGALGLILPGLLGIRRDLTPIAAACLVVIMVGAVTVTILTLTVQMAILPFVVGVLAIVVARGRRNWLGRGAS